jgi:uncharacterized lipoprotein YddW (UPF0748 family)
MLRLTAGLPLGSRRLLIVLAVAATGCLATRSSNPDVPRIAVALSDADTATVSARVGDPVEAQEPEVLFDAPPPPPREFRGAWITPLIGGHVPDWPSRPGLTAEQQQHELRRLLDHAREIGLNAILLHVRTAADAFYPTGRAPWTVFLSGQSGASPGYDALQFAIDEAHVRGLELHAWFNPFRAMLPPFAGKAAPTHVTRTRPEWIRRYGTQTWIDPGEPAARAWVLDAIMEVVERYDVDGIHIDDYFYPYREQETITRVVNGRRTTQRRDIPFPDDATWQRYGARAGFVDRPSWRRANVDDFVQQMYEGVKQRKPWVSVGISPFGIWRSGVPAGVTGLDAYGEIYADARKWLREGWLDYIAPQLYWTLDGTQSRFTRLDEWWRSENPMGRHVWPGLFTARSVMPSQQWAQDEIPTQILRTRQWRQSSDDVPGHVHFRLGALAANGGALGQRVASQYRGPALVPASPWLADARPLAPTLTRAPAPGTILVRAQGDAPVAWWLVQSRNGSGDWESRVVRAAPLMELDGLAGRQVAVSAIDRVGQASAPALILVP